MTEKISPEWIRLPKPKERCPHTGLSRTSLVEIIDERDPATGEYVVRQYRKERHGKQRRIRLIHRPSLMHHLECRSQAQNLQWKEGVNNPRGYSVETVINNREIFRLFIGVDAPPLTDEVWEEGSLSRRSSRVQVLRELGWIV